MADSKKNALDRLTEYRDALKDAQFDGKLTENGQATLKAIEDGSLTSPLVGNLLQGASFNLSDEVMGWIRANMTPGLSVNNAIDIERAALLLSLRLGPLWNSLSVLLCLLPSPEAALVCLQLRVKYCQMQLWAVRLLSEPVREALMNVWQIRALE